MFYNSNSNDSPLNDLLNKPDVQLHEILAVPSIITDVQSYNEKLVEVLTKDEYLTDMLNILIVTPEPNENGIIYFDIRYTISEILTAYVDEIYETLAGNEKYLEILFKPFLSRKFVTDEDRTQSESESSDQSKPQSDSSIRTPINSVTCSLILKVAKMLCTQSHDNMMRYFRKNPILIDGLIDNIDVNAVSEFLVKFVQAIPTKTAAERTRYRQFLSDQNFIGKVLSKISQDANQEVVSLKCLQTLTDVVLSIRSSKEMNPLKNDIENVTVVNKILALVLNVSYTRTTFISTGFDFLKSLFELPERYSQNLDQSSPTPYSSFQASVRSNPRHIMTRDDIEVNSTTLRPILDAISNQFESFKAILNTSIIDREIRTAYGGVIKSPLGPHRLAILELLDRLVELDQCSINKRLVECDFGALFLRFLLEYPLNTLLYRVIINIVNRLIVFTLSKVDSDDVDLKRCSSILIKYLFHDLKLIPKLMEMWKETDSVITGCSIRIRSLYRMFAAVIFTTILNYPLSTELSISIITPQISLEKWNNFCEEEIQEYNRRNDPETNLPNTPSEESGYNVPDDYSRSYEMCLISKVGSDFPDFSYVPIVCNLPLLNTDLNSNPLPNLFVTTPEDRDNAENFELTCNYLLSTRNSAERGDEDDLHNDDDDDDDENNDGALNINQSSTAQQSASGGSDNTNDNATFNLGRTVYMNHELTETPEPFRISSQADQDKLEYDDFVKSEDDDVLTPDFIDYLFTEVGKENHVRKLNQVEPGFSIDFEPPRDKVNSKPKVPRLIFNPSITSNARPMPMPINTNRVPVTPPKPNIQIDTSVHNDKPDSARENSWNIPKDDHNQPKSDSDYLNEVDADEPELKSSFSRFLAYNEDDENEDGIRQIGIEDDDNDDDYDDDDDIPLSSRLEKERTITTENLSEVDQLLDNKIWNSPSNSINNLNLSVEDDKDSTGPVTIDTVVNVTPTIEHTVAKVSPESSAHNNVSSHDANCIKFYKIGEARDLMKEDFLTDKPDFLPTENPFSPKLERFTMPAVPANMKKPTASFNSKQSLVYESNKFIKLTDSTGNFIGPTQPNHQSHFTTTTAATTVTNYNKANTKLHTSNSRIKLNSPGKNITATGPTQYTTSTCIKSISSSVISPIPWTSFQTSYGRSTSAPNKLITHNSSQDPISTVKPSKKSPQSIDKLSSLSETDVELSNSIAKSIPNGDVNK